MLQVQHDINGGRCGVCGDDWRLPEPRPHERGGRFGRGVVTADYSEGQVVPVTIRLSANHKVRSLPFSLSQPRPL